MQQYLTLEEAAKILQISPDELREMAKKKTIRAFQDRGSWRFRLQDVEEMARQRGLGSDVEVPLGDPRSTKKDDLLAVDFGLDDDAIPLGAEKPSSGPKSSKSKGPSTPKPGSDSDVRLVLDDEIQFDIDLGGEAKPPGKSAIGPKSPTVKTGSPKPSKRHKPDASDSGVRLVSGADPNDSDVAVIPPDSGVSKKTKSPSDSDIRLQDAQKKKAKDDSVITEEIDLDAEQAKLAEKSQKGKSKKSSASPGAVLPTESPFELSEPDLKLEKPGKTGKKKSSMEDSSSDFEAIPFDATKSAPNLGSGDQPILTEDSDIDFGKEVGGGRKGNSGINLQEPIDSGISLESGGSDELIFDATDESGSTPKPKKPAPGTDEDSSSEFELSLDDSDSSSSSEFELNVDDPESASSSEFELSVEGGEDSSSSEFELSVEDSDSASSSEFELSLDSSENSSLIGESGSDSEFELTLDDDGSLAPADEGRDIFEETNFDVPALEDESGSEAVAIDDGDTDLEGKDFDISLDEDSSTGEESGSQVVSLDEEDADEQAATVAKPRAKPSKKTKIAPSSVAEDEPELDVDMASSGQVPKKGKPQTEEEADSDEELARPAAAAAPADWGAFPAVLLLPTVMVMFVVGLMGFELVRGMWGYNQPSAVGKPLIDTFARSFVADKDFPK